MRWNFNLLNLKRPCIITRLLFCVWDKSPMWSRWGEQFFPQWVRMKTRPECRSVTRMSGESDGLGGNHLGSYHHAHRETDFLVKSRSLGGCSTNRLLRPWVCQVIETKPWVQTQKIMHHPKIYIWLSSVLRYVVLLLMKFYFIRCISFWKASTK